MGANLIRVFLSLMPAHKALLYPSICTTLVVESPRVIFALSVFPLLGPGMCVSCVDVLGLYHTY